MKNIESSKTKAIKEAKRQLRNMLGCERLTWSRVDHSKQQCGCGETYAVKVSAESKGEFESVVVGICPRCAEFE